MSIFRRVIDKLRYDQFALGGLGNCVSPGSSPCCGCAVKFCFSNCASGGPNVGYTVNVLSGTTTLGTGTTGADGCCTISGLSAGNFTVNFVNGAGQTINGATRTLACNGTVTTPAPCCIKICFNGCAGGGLPCAGMVVTLTLGGQTAFQGSTDSTGCVHVPVPSIGSTNYTLSLGNLPPGYAFTPITQAFSCSTGSYTFGVSAAPNYTPCCTGIPSLTPMTLTDANGSWSFAFFSASNSYAVYYTVSNALAMDPSCNLITGPIIVGYSSSSCNTTGSFTITRLWTAQKSSTTDPNIRYMGGTASGGNAFPYNQACASFTHQDSASITFSTPQCGAFGPFSGSLTASGSNWLADPVGGAVSIS